MDGYAPNASHTTRLESFHGEPNIADRFTQRYTGFFTPKVTGNHTFWSQSDDYADVWLSEVLDAPGAAAGGAGGGGGVAINRTRVLYQRGYVPGMMRTNQLHQSRSAPTPLEAGRRYLLEMRFAEGGGGDIFSVALIAPTPAAHKTPAVRGGFNRVREHQSIALTADFDWETHRLDLGAGLAGGSYTLAGPCPLFHSHSSISRPA